jgi:hypothetical protein
MTLDVKQALPVVANGQPIQIIINNAPPVIEEKQDQTAGRASYLAAQALFHIAMMTRLGSLANEKGQWCMTPVYQSSYLIGAGLGAVYGLYKAFNADDQIVNLEKNSLIFAEGSTAQKAWTIFESYLSGPLLMTSAEAYYIIGDKESAESGKTPGVTGGGLVAAYWGFSLGSDAAKFAYQKLTKSNQPKE